MAFNTNINYAELSKYGRTSYVDPATGKTVYLDRVGPEGSTLTPMNLSNPSPITNTPTSTGFNINDILKGLLSGGAGGGSGALGAPMAGGENLISKALSGPLLFGSRYKAPAATSDKYFEDLLASVTGPSSAEEATKLAEGQGLEQLLAEIDRETSGKVASSKLDYLDRGIGGPGQLSDIEANAVAQLEAGGTRSKAGARTSVLLNQLARAAEKEKGKTAALGLRYQTGAAADTEAQRIAAQGAMSESQILTSLLGEQFKGDIALGEGAAERQSREKMNYMSQVLDYAIKSGTLSQDDAQFYAKLISAENTAAADRSAAYERQKLESGGGKKERDWFDYLQGFTDITSKLFGGGDKSTAAAIATLAA